MDHLTQTVDVTDALQGRLQACEEQYALHFAGQPRLTSDPDMLAALIDEVERVRATAAARDASTLAEMAASQHALYSHEHGAIVAAMEQAGPAGRVAAQLQRRASLVMHRYSRHFAGAPRPSRDLGLLGEISADLQDLHAALQPLSVASADDIGHFLALLQREAVGIAESRTQGAPAQQAAASASAANTLLQTYVTLCVGRRKLACRPELLARLRHALQECADAMEQLRAAGFDAPHHAEALGQLAAQRSAWEQEHAQLVRAHAGAKPEDVAAALDSELDDALAAYNALPADASRQVLCGLCDRLDELERQLRRTAADQPTPSLIVAADALALVCGRFDSAP